MGKTHLILWVFRVLPANRNNQPPKHEHACKKLTWSSRPVVCSSQKARALRGCPSLSSFRWKASKCQSMEHCPRNASNCAHNKVRHLNCKGCCGEAAARRVGLRLRPSCAASAGNLMALIHQPSLGRRQQSTCCWQVPQVPYRVFMVPQAIQTLRGHTDPMWPYRPYVAIQTLCGHTDPMWPYRPYVAIQTL